MLGGWLGGKSMTSWEIPCFNGGFWRTSLICMVDFPANHVWWHWRVYENDWTYIEKYMKMMEKNSGNKIPLSFHEILVGLLGFFYWIIIVFNIWRALKGSIIHCNQPTKVLNTAHVEKFEDFFVGFWWMFFVVLGFLALWSLVMKEYFSLFLEICRHQ